jgi:hypothetical protein
MQEVADSCTRLYSYLFYLLAYRLLQHSVHPYYNLVNVNALEGTKKYG